MNGAPATTHPEGVRYAPGLFAFTSLVVLFVLYQLVGGGLTLLAVGSAITEDNVMLARTATVLAQILFLLVPTLWLVRRQHGSWDTALPMRMPSVIELLLAVLGMAALLQAAEGYMYFQGKVPVPASLEPFAEEMKRMIEATYRTLIEARSLPELLFVMLVAAVTPSVCEEVMFRGLIQKNAVLATSPVKGFVITGVVFGAYHLNPFQLLPLAAMGVYFGYLQHRSRSLIVPMTVHLMNNALSVTAAYVYGFDTSDMPSLLKGNAEDASDLSVLVTTLFFLAAFAVILLAYRRVTEPRPDGEAA